MKLNFKLYCKLGATYSVNVLASCSVVLNALTGGSYRNTFSARTGYAAMHGKKWALVAEKYINEIPYLAENHCYLEAKSEGLLK